MIHLSQAELDPPTKSKNANINTSKSNLMKVSGREESKDINPNQYSIATILFFFFFFFRK